MPCLGPLGYTKLKKKMLEASQESRLPALPTKATTGLRSFRYSFAEARSTEARNEDNSAKTKAWSQMLAALECP